VFQADPGYAITGVNMALMDWSWGISYLGGSYSFAANWHMDPANPGIDALAYSGCDGWGCIHGNVNGGSGNYDQSYWFPWSGGGREYINIMNPDYLVTLPPTDRFALQFNTHLQVDNANFSVRGLSVQVYTAAIPEPANLSLMLAGLALAGVVIHRRRRS
jgi:hypothetical protein